MLGKSCRARPPFYEEALMAAESSPAVSGVPVVLLRLEGLGLFALGVLFYAQSGARWSFFAVLFLVPDVSFAGYLAGPRIGAAVYNAAHTMLGPIMLAGPDPSPAAGD